MAGLKITLPGEFTNRALPVLRNDAILTDGSLFLAETMHPAAPWQAGIPGNGYAIPNLADAAALLGPGDHSGRCQINGTPTAGKELIERTGRGGVHMIVSPTASTGTAMLLQFPDSVMAYLANRTPANNFYLSVWGRVTRPAAANGSARAFTSLARYNNGVYGLMLSNVTAQNRPRGADQIGAHSEGEAAAGPMYQAIAGRSNERISLDTYTAPGARTFGTFGFTTPFNVGAGQQSWVFYRAYLEDLTVSGRSWAEVDALDYSLYRRQVITPGGRYYADTFTNPATIA